MSQVLSGDPRIAFFWAKLKMKVARTRFLAAKALNVVKGGKVSMYTVLRRRKKDSWPKRGQKLDGVVEIG
ncbi:hypothetical protein Tco_1429460 [Tanacetum coccineum]